MKDIVPYPTYKKKIEEPELTPRLYRLRTEIESDHLK